MEAHGPLEERLLFLTVVWVGKAALDRAYGLTRFVIVESNALRAKLGIDDVDLVTLADGFVGALGFASPTVDAVGRDVRGHDGRR
jgi:hypothetical protein